MTGLITVQLSKKAELAELVDALDSGSSRGNSVDVRVILAANFSQRYPRSRSDVQDTL